MRGERFSFWLTQLIFIALVAAVWHYAVTSGSVEKLLVPPLPHTFRDLWSLLLSPGTYHHLQVTMYTYLVAMTLALCSGIIVGTLGGTSRYFGELIEPILFNLNAIPIIMIYPLCILFFGIGPESKIAFSATYAFFPISLHTMRGIRHVEIGIIDAARSMGAGPFQLLWKVRFPAAFPMIMTGIKLGAVYAFLSTVAGEMIASIEGIGTQVSEALQLFRTSQGYAWILIIILLVMLLGALLNLMEGLVKSVR